MIFRLAIRSLATRPLRTAVLSVGFGLSIAVMAELLGVGEVILEQAHAPALVGGGDVLLTGAVGSLESARFVASGVLGSEQFRSRVAAASPSRRATMYVLSANASGPIAVRGGIPSRERAVGDPEVAGQAGWIDEPRDTAWIDPRPGDLLRAMDRFHAVPATEGGAEHGAVGRASYAEWLYFNARSPDGAERFYLTFMAGAPDEAGARPMVVRLQLDRSGATTNFSAAGSVPDRDLLDRAPDLEVAGNRVRVQDDGRYVVSLALQGESTGARVSGEIVLTPIAGRSLPPAAIHGARGWVSGYTVPVMSGAFSGTLRVGGEEVRVDGMAGYHDHNWGFWEGVRWQWGQVGSGDLSIVYGRVFPPPDVADPGRMPGFLGVIGPQGPIAFSTDVSIREDDDRGAPRVVTVEARDRQMQLTLRLDVRESVRTSMGLTRGASGAMTFVQLGGEYHVTGRAAGRDVNFTARGSAETFR
ncbi:MAG: hypothetical protein DMF93_14255 [Acidobacteria bacterium]|nr:MAG: hypothetical protein DMF93_14255 [Acidobacteriota bacterium]